MSERFSYVKYDEQSVKVQNGFKTLFEHIEMAAEGMLKGQSCGRSKALMMTALEEAYMWCGKAIRDIQRAERGAVEQPERKDG